MWLSTELSTVVDVPLLTRTLDVDFNGLTGVVDFSLLTRTLDVDFNGVTVVVDVSLLTRVYPLIFHLPPPGIFIIYGGSGCGH
jgi:hypothetical protein